MPSCRNEFCTGGVVWAAIRIAECLGCKTKGWYASASTTGSLADSQPLAAAQSSHAADAIRSWVIRAYTPSPQVPCDRFQVSDGTLVGRSD
jgi:hypothetical protein